MKQSKRQSITQSLQWRLLLTLTMVCLLFSGLVASFSFYQSYLQAQKLQDTKLASLVSLAKSHDLSIENDQIDIDLKEINSHQPSGQNSVESASLFNLAQAIDQDITTDQTLIYWIDDTRLAAYFSQAALDDLTKKNDGLYEVQGLNGSWRLYLYTQPNIKKDIHPKPSSRHSTIDNQSASARTHSPKPLMTPPYLSQRRLVIGELLDIRNQLAWQSAKKILLPLLLLIPLLLLVIILTVHRMFQPLSQITQSLTASVDPNLLSRIISSNSMLVPADSFNQFTLNQLKRQKLPSEILPFIQVIRQQMQSLLDSLAINERFVSNASHQLRTPMTAILLQAEQIKLSPTATAIQIAEQSVAIDRLIESIKRNNLLINQLLTLSKSEQKHHTLPVLPFSPSEVITEVLLDYYPIASQKNINLGVSRLDEVVIPIAELHFKIIVQNLLDNAIKYTPIAGRVDIGLFSENGHTYLQVQDSGIGIDEAELDKILEPFYRASAVTVSPKRGSGATTSASVIEGFGLGLAIVNNLVTASQATLTIANQRNLHPNSPNYRKNLAQMIRSIAISPTPDVTSLTPLMPETMPDAFSQGLIVQICW